jgi:hypothetical protein
MSIDLVLDNQSKWRFEREDHYVRATVYGAEFWLHKDRVLIPYASLKEPRKVGEFPALL